MRVVILCFLALIGGSLHLCASEWVAVDVDFTWAPLTPVVGQTVTFTATGSPLGVVTRWDWEIKEYNTWLRQYDNQDDPWVAPPKSETDNIMTHQFRRAVYEAGHLVKLVCYDAEGRTVGSESHYVNVTAPAPTVGFNWMPSEPRAGEAITFTGQASSSRGIVAEWFDFCDGPCGGDREVSSTATRTYSTPRTVTVRFAAVDQCGAYARTEREVVVGELELVPCFTYTPQNPCVGDEITFDASCSSGDIDLYEWDFGDGTAIGKIVTHTFRDTFPDRYSVELTVGSGGVSNPTSRYVETQDCTPPEEETYSIRIFVEGEGTITPTRTVTGLRIGDQRTFTARPADGWEFVEWRGQANGDRQTLTVIVSADHRITAVFEELGNTDTAADGSLVSVEATVTAAPEPTSNGDRFADTNTAVVVEEIPNNGSATPEDILLKRAAMNLLGKLSTPLEETITSTEVYSPWLGLLQGVAAGAIVLATPERLTNRIESMDQYVSILTSRDSTIWSRAIAGYFYLVEIEGVASDILVAGDAYVRILYNADHYGNALSWLAAAAGSLSGVSALAGMSGIGVMTLEAGAVLQIGFAAGDITEEQFRVLNLQRNSIELSERQKQYVGRLCGRRGSGGSHLWSFLVEADASDSPAGYASTYVHHVASDWFAALNKYEGYRTDNRGPLATYSVDALPDVAVDGDSLRVYLMGDVGLDLRDASSAARCTLEIKVQTVDEAGNRTVVLPFHTFYDSAQIAEAYFGFALGSGETTFEVQELCSVAWDPASPVMTIEYTIRARTTRNGLDVQEGFTCKLELDEQGHVSR